MYANIDDLHNVDSVHYGVPSTWDSWVIVLPVSLYIPQTRFPDSSSYFITPRQVAGNHRDP